MSRKVPLSPAQFDERCRLLTRAFGFLSETSGLRSKARNKQVGGDPASKHVLGMARDLVPDYVLTEEKQEEVSDFVRKLGLWFKWHDVGSGYHLHVQGLEPGPVPTWWKDKHGL